ncbi:hypothetical protein MMC19_001559 [Ptychographa xylographoides]|nr:hypothetical protein [Ptychographa xylographoides]
MGGKAFSHPPYSLSTPRIPTALYTFLRDYYTSLIRAYYAQVVCPIEAPDKASHGDIDVLVSSPYPQTTNSSLAIALRSSAVFKTSGSPSTSFAVPYPDLPDVYIQLDIHVCSPTTFAWEVFTASHGDLWNIIGTSLRHFGLTANNIGFYVRIAEIEVFDRKRSSLLLTGNPDNVLDFLGLDGQKYGSSFASAEELYTYAVGMRFFKREKYVKEKLKANDRKRMGQRVMYRQFVEEWLPERPGVGVGDGRDQETRESVLEEVLNRYGKRGEYEEMISVWRAERGDLAIKQEARKRKLALAKAEMEYADAWIGTSQNA